MDPLQRVPSYAVQPPGRGLDRLCELRPGDYANAVQDTSLPGGQARNQGQVVRYAPLGATPVAPTTNAAVFDRLRNRGQRINMLLINYGFELAGHQPVIGGIVGDAKRNRSRLARPGEGEVHLLRRHSLVIPEAKSEYMHSWRTAEALA